MPALDVLPSKFSYVKKVNYCYFLSLLYTANSYNAKQYRNLENELIMDSPLKLERKLKKIEESIRVKINEIGNRSFDKKFLTKLNEKF